MKDLIYNSLYHVDHIQVFLQYNVNTKSVNVYNRICSKNRYKQGLLEAKRILKNLKFNGCAICGYNECDMALEFHHTNPQDKSFCVGLNAVAYRPKKIIDEINKCILLCANCHRIIEHGGII